MKLLEAISKDLAVNILLSLVVGIIASYIVYTLRTIVACMFGAVMFFIVLKMRGAIDWPPLEAVATGAVVGFIIGLGLTLMGFTIYPEMIAYSIANLLGLKGVSFVIVMYSVAGEPTYVLDWAFPLGMFVIGMVASFTANIISRLIVVSS